MTKVFLTVLTMFVMFTFMGCPDPAAPEGGIDFFIVSFDKNNTDVGSTEAIPNLRTASGLGGTVTSLPGVNPMRAGWLFRGWNTSADGTGTAFDATTFVSGNITVFARWEPGFTLNFDQNFDGGTSSILEVLPDETPGDALPDPARYAFELIGWNTRRLGTGDWISNDTLITEDLTLFGIWNFVGGTPTLVDGSLVHNLPLLEAGPDTTLDMNFVDGILTLGGRVQYSFPEAVRDYDGDFLFDYLVVSTTVLEGEGAGSGVTIRPFNAGAPGAGDPTWNNAGMGNMMPWMSEADGQTQVLNLTASAGNTAHAEAGGFQWQGAVGTVVRVNSVVFHVAPRYTVNFDINLPGQDNPPAATNVWGVSEDHNGFGVGAANWPAIQLGESRESGGTDYWFLGWFYDEVLFTADTHVSGNITLAAGWAVERPSIYPHVSTTQNAQGVWRFSMPDGQTWGDVQYITFESLIDDPVMMTRSQIRAHIVITNVTADGDPVAPSAAGIFAAGWGSGRVLNVNDNVPFTTVFGADYELNTWRRFTWSFDENPGEGHALFRGSAVQSRTNDVVFGVGFAINPPLGLGNFDYFIRDVALIMTNGDRVYSHALTGENIHHIWNAGGMPGLTGTIRSFRTVEIPEDY